ncbi:uncharacterized protein LOC114770324 [Denticeps clupeoides]|uniref:MARVEL domain-containing protein n=1 Tax=Denticeps clupeoides TaxID=299321 RepID=A0AAY4EKR4_9TELE|nr:uncharacterized protein LOC114770324 [Denticeps clupeoides]
MGINSQDAIPPPGGLSPQQVHSFLRVEPKTLGALQIIVGVLTMCLSATLLQISELHFVVDIIVLLFIVAELIASGAVLIHTGRYPTLFWVKTMLVLHLVSLAFTTAALGLLSRNLPYRQTTYHCEHCRRLEIFSVLLIDGILGTLVLFLLLELVICITAILFGLGVLARGGIQIVGMSQRLTTPPVQVQPVIVPPVQVAVVVSEPEPVHQPEPDTEEVHTPPTETTEPQVVPIEPQVIPIEPEVVSLEPQVVPLEPQVETAEPQVFPIEPEVELINPRL